MLYSLTARSSGSSTGRPRGSVCRSRPLVLGPKNGSRFITNDLWKKTQQSASRTARAFRLIARSPRSYASACRPRSWCTLRRFSSDKRYLVVGRIDTMFESSTFSRASRGMGGSTSVVSVKRLRVRYTVF